MRILKILALVVTGSLAVHAQQGPPLAEALDGVDTVILLKEGKEVFGKSAFRSERGRFVYLFASADTKAEFDKAPEKYAVQLGGACARMGKTVSGNPSDYLVHDGKIYIFGSDACHKAFAAAPAKYLQPAPAPMPADPAAARRGAALLDKAVAAVGGAAKLDALTSYAETSSEIQKRPTGDITVSVRRMWQFPSGVRFDRTAQLPNGQRPTYGTLLTSAGAFSLGGPAPAPVIPEALPSVQQDMWRQIVPLLRARRQRGVTVAALPSATVDGVAVDRVRVRRAGMDVTLNLDARTGKIHSTTFIDRGPESTFGEITLIYLDFKPVQGLTLPFSEKGLFNGAPQPALARSIDAITVNEPLDAALFRASAGGK
jgi:YHS domain-containing protein